MEKNRGTRGLRVIAIIALVIAVVGLTVAYAAMSTTLKITGTASMNSASWNIRFANVNATTSGNATYQLPTVSSTALTDYSVTLTKPGDSVVFTFDVINSGTMNAFLATLMKGKPSCNGIGETASTDSSIVCGNITYLLQYDDGTTVRQDDLLKASSIQKMKLMLAYRSDAADLPIGSVTISGLDITMIYNQK